MKKIRLIALDLDGTLLDDKKSLTKRNREALLECMKQGIEVVPCTGRIWPGIPEFIRNLPGIQYAITVNGGMIENVARHQVLDERKLEWKKAVEILKLAGNYETMYDIYIGKSGYGEARFMNHMGDYGIGHELEKMIRDTRIIVPDVIEEIINLAKPIDKINFFFGNPEERMRVRRILLERGDVEVSASFSNNLEINGPGATKGEALLRLASHLGIDACETMGFGDGENDLTLIKNAGIGVAMGNAVENLKSEADYVTTTNCEDGVAEALWHLLKIGRPCMEP